MIHHFKSKMFWLIWVDYNQSILPPEVINDNGTWRISTCIYGATLFTCQQHSSLIMPIDMLPAYFASPLLFAVMVIQLFLSLFSRYHLWKAAISCSFACFSFPKSRFSKWVPLISSSSSWMAWWCSDLRSTFILPDSCCRICENIDLRQCSLKFFAVCYLLENSSSYFPSSLMYRSYFLWIPGSVYRCAYLIRTVHLKIINKCLFQCSLMMVAVFLIFTII